MRQNALTACLISSIQDFLIYNHYKFWPVPETSKPETGPNERKDPRMTHSSYNVLFLCTGNSARSILAEAILNRISQGRFKAYSAGSNPTGTVNPNALSLLKRLNYDTDFAASKSWDLFAKQDAPKIDFVFTVCDNAAGETCPVWPGQPMTAHWGIPDPAAARGSDSEIALAFSDTYRMLNARISIFAALPIASIDRLALQNRLDAIGQSKAQAD